MCLYVWWFVLYGWLTPVAGTNATESTATTTAATTTTPMQGKYCHFFCTHAHAHRKRDMIRQLIAHKLFA